MIVTKACRSLFLPSRRFIFYNSISKHLKELKSEKQSSSKEITLFPLADVSFNRDQLTVFKARHFLTQPFLLTTLAICLPAATYSVSYLLISIQAKALLKTLLWSFFSGGFLLLSKSNWQTCRHLIDKITVDKGGKVTITTLTKTFKMDANDIRLLTNEELVTYCSVIPTNQVNYMGIMVKNQLYLLSIKAAERHELFGHVVRGNKIEFI